ncbi:MAG: YqeG family HAD IIIA-type phosphatase [Lachnospiraceae bacterium]|nr:YqeG family HAD IIIA-type phosphatase [Lachnospiraceae bacterium]
MKNIFYPNEYLDSAYSIDYEKMYEKGYRGVIFDIDNTLVEHGAPADERAVALFERLRSIGINSVLLSNNKEPRVKSFNDKVHSKYIFKGGKPKPSGYRKAMEMMGTDTSNTFFVGDQIFTDVMGANIAGIYTFLTMPIDPREEIQIVLKRYLEKPIIFFYKKSKKRNRI